MSKKKGERERGVGYKKEVFADGRQRERVSEREGERDRGKMLIRFITGL